IVVCPTVREKDGLAMSSRNVYLSPEQRQTALVLYRSLMRVQMLADRGEQDAAQLIAVGKEVLAEEPSVRFDYFEIVGNDTLEAIASVSGVAGGALVAVAAFVGETRLIDNIVLV